MNPRPIQPRFRLLAGLILLCVGLANIDALLHRHPHFPAEETYGFYAWFGLLACGMCALLAHIVGLLIRRREDYYD